MIENNSNVSSKYLAIQPTNRRYEPNSILIVLTHSATDNFKENIPVNNKELGD